MKLCVILVLIVLLMLSGLSFSQADTGGEQTLDEIAQEVGAIERGITTGKLTSQVHRAPEHCAPYEASDRTMYRQGSVVRKLLVEMGSDDSMVTQHNYYRDGALLHMRIIAGAANGTQQEWRRSYSQGGTILDDHYEQIEGPGYTFGDVLSRIPAVKQPEQFFHAQDDCSDRG